MTDWLARRVGSFGFAFAGLAHMLRSQPNVRVHLVAGLSVIASALLLRATPLEMAVLVLTIGGVLTAEAINTAVEAAVDAVGGPPSTVGKHAKDSAAAAVLLAAMAAVGVGVLVLGPKLWGWAGLPS